MRLQGKPLCRVTADGGVYASGAVKGNAKNDAMCQVADIIRTTTQYMKLMEAAPPLQTGGLEGDYHLLSEFNGIVLAGQPTQQGVQFATWERDFDKTGLC